MRTLKNTELNALGMCLFKICTPPIVLLFSFVAFAQGGHQGHGAAAVPAPAQQTSKATQKNAHQESPKTEKESASEESRIPVDVSTEQQGKIGLKVTKVEKRPLAHTIRTVGNLTADESREAHVHSRINGWIENIYADAVGKPVKKNQPLFELYSPDLVSTQEEYLAARGKGGAGQEIARAALERMRGWGVSEREIEKLRSSGKVKRAIAFDSPVDGFIVNKTAIRGMYVTPEMELYYIADLAKVWVIVTLYESDIAIIKEGDLAQITLPYDPSKTLNARISYIYPEIEKETRTSRARIELDNRSFQLKPGMYVNVEIKKDLGEAFTVPEDAVIDTGLRKLVFVKSGETRFEPKEITIGPRVENRFAVLNGLSGGEEVVSSALFLIDAESKLQAALQRGGQAPSHGSHGGGKSGKK